MADESGSDSASGRAGSGVMSKKRPREDDDFADSEDGESAQLPTADVNTGSAKSGIMVHGQLEHRV